MSNLVAFLYVRQPSVRATEIIIKEVKIWGYSSVGRATGSQSVGRRFDPDYLHQ